MISPLPPVTELPPTDAAAEEEFFALARSARLNLGSRWIRGYVDWEWSHIRHLFRCGLAAPEGRDVLEFGCNLGATSIVLALLGARVTAVDPNPDFLTLARANAARYGVASRITFSRIQGSAPLPWPEEVFDLICMNSVLEYIPHRGLEPILLELGRTLRPGGTVLICSTSNRWSPVEPHSGAWWVSFLPRALEERVSGRRHDAARAVSPREAKRPFYGYEDLVWRDKGEALFRAKQAMGVGRGRLLALRCLSALARPFGISAGMLTPYFTLALQKPARAA